MKKRILLLSLCILVLFVGCNDKEEKKEVSKEFTYEIYGKEYNVDFSKAPKRAVTMSQFMTEMLLALGLEDNMVGTAFMDNEIYPEFKEAYDKIPVLSDKYPSKEILFSKEPDFVSGWTSAFDEKRVASADEMIAMGAKPFLAKSISKDGSIETLYQDFLDLGKIFRVEDRANKLVNEMKAEIKMVQDKIGETKEEDKIKVLAFDSISDNNPFVVGNGGISGDIIRKAMGKNIFEDVNKGYATVSIEQIVKRNPDVIVIVDYGDVSYEDKVNILKSNDGLKELQAIKENKFIKIGLADLSPGIRNIDAIKTLAEGLYGVSFK